MHGEVLYDSYHKVSILLVCSSEFFYTSLHKIAICHTNYICQAVRQGPWTSFFSGFVFFSLIFGPNGNEIKKAVPPTNNSQKLWKICWMFLTMILTNLRSTWWVLRFWVSDFFTIPFSKYQIHHAALLRNPKPQLSGKRAVGNDVELNLGPFECL